ncbi:hypothetical protein EG835_08400, partial [bacterium]|nr:hypothetical protein [bacterium]
MSAQATIPGSFAVIGGGRMGEAIIKGLLDAGAATASAFTVVEPDAARREVLSSTHGIRSVADAADAVPGAAIVLLAVKPQVIVDVVAGLAAHVGHSLVISIAAGISCARLESLLGT